MRKYFLIFLFLTTALLFDVIIYAANKNKKMFRIIHPSITKGNDKENIVLMPNVFIL